VGWPVEQANRDRQRRESAARIWRRSVHAHVADEPSESDVSRETSEATESTTAVEWDQSEAAQAPATADAQTAPEPDVSRETSSMEPAPASPLDSTDSAYQDGFSAADVSRETEIDIMDTPIAREAMRAVHVLNPSGTRQLPRPPHRRVLTLANQKGGVGKTTSTVNLGVALALHGVRVLVIDLDPQGNASTGLGVPHQQGTPSIYDVLVDERPLSEVVVPVEVSPLLKCAPATIDLAGSEIELVSMERRESRLKQAINQYAEEVDYVLIDCPPSLGLLTVNAFVAATEVLIPIQCEYYALEGLGQLLNNIELVTSHLNPALVVSTILLTMYDGRTKLADQVAAEVREHFGDRVLRSVIPRSVRVSEAPGFGQSVITYDPGSRGALSYLDAADELAQRGVEEKAGQGS
jgi:chromosome partitioning protein